jgi:hypothetical protein
MRDSLCPIHFLPQLLTFFFFQISKYVFILWRLTAGDHWSDPPTARSPCLFYAVSKRATEVGSPELKMQRQCQNCYSMHTFSNLVFKETSICLLHHRRFNDRVMFARFRLTVVKNSQFVNLEPNDTLIDVVAMFISLCSSTILLKLLKVCISFNLLDISAGLSEWRNRGASMSHARYREYSILVSP